MIPPGRRSLRIVLFGGTGLLGRTLAPQLTAAGHHVVAPTHGEVDCRDGRAVTACLMRHRPEAVVVAAGRVGGIQANLRHGADYLYDNALINLVTLNACDALGVPRAIVFGGSCMYPRDLDGPIHETDLLRGPLEPTSEPYALAKITAVRYAALVARRGRCRAVAGILTNLYGDHDRFDAQEGHLVASLIVKLHEAKVRGEQAMALWGDGTPRRDFLHAWDAARACRVLVEAAEAPELVNVGSGADLSVAEIARTVAAVVGFQGDLMFTGAVANGTPRKLLAIDRITALGWRPTLSLEEGVRRAYDSYLAQQRQTAVAAAAP